MTESGLLKMIVDYKSGKIELVDVQAAVHEYSASLNAAKPIVKQSLPPIEQDLLDEAVGDVVKIARLNDYKTAIKLIKAQFYVASNEDLGGNAV